MDILVLGLDLSITATGVARPDGSLDTFKPGTKGDARLLEIGDALVLDMAGVDLVVVEDYVVNSYSAALLGMLHGVVRRDLMYHGVPYVAVPPSSLKVFATGRGNATKADMRMELFRRLEVDERDDNRVDAAWLRLLGHHLLGRPLLELPKTHTRALSKLSAPDL